MSGSANTTDGMSNPQLIQQVTFTHQRSVRHSHYDLEILPQRALFITNKNHIRLH